VDQRATRYDQHAGTVFHLGMANSGGFAGRQGRFHRQRRDGRHNNKGNATQDLVHTALQNAPDAERPYKKKRSD
jgi:hypothetical protein